MSKTIETNIEAIRKDDILNSDKCKRSKEAVDKYLAEKCNNKFNSMDPCKESNFPCPCLEEKARCITLEMPDIRPCISITWGDSKCDCIETDDVEVLCITVCNCYNNVSFNNFNIGYIYITDKAGNPVPKLPDGTPSVDVLPIGPICFGDIGPCVKNKPVCVSREIVLYNRGAKAQDYQIQLKAICFNVCHTFIDEACFTFALCNS